MSDIFAMIAAERRELADVIEQLSDAEWQAPSAVQGWKVRHVASHLVWPLETSLPKIALQLLRHGMSFERTADAVADADTRPRGELARVLRAQAENRFIPPRSGPRVPLTEVLVHGLDIRWPLGRRRKIPDERARHALELLVKPAAGKRFAPMGLPAGLRFEATDMAWTHGEGPVVKGPADALILTLCGRGAAASELSGEGVATVKQRVWW